LCLRLVGLLAVKPHRDRPSRGCGLVTALVVVAIAVDLATWLHFEWFMP
jgi:hypothetical protein